MLDPITTLAAGILGKLIGGDEEPQPMTTAVAAPPPVYIESPPPPPPPEPPWTPGQFLGNTGYFAQSFADGGLVQGLNPLWQAALMQGQQEPIPGGRYQFGVINPAYQPLADGLNYWISGGFTGPNAPGTRGPQQSFADGGAVEGHMPGVEMFGGPYGHVTPNLFSFAEGGPVKGEMPDEDLIQAAMQSMVTGGDEQIIEEFVDRFGEQALADLMSKINNNKGGRAVAGPGDGLSDSVPAMVDGAAPATLSDGEFVMPADVVSGLGNGSTDAGVKKLEAMIANVRLARTGKDAKPGRVELR